MRYQPLPRAQPSASEPPVSVRAPIRTNSGRTTLPHQSSAGSERGILITALSTGIQLARLHTVIFTASAPPICAGGSGTALTSE